MVEVTGNIKKNDEVFAKKELKMFGNVFANENDVFKVSEILDNSINVTKDKTTLLLDKKTFNEYFELRHEDKYDKETEPKVVYATAASLPNDVSADAIHEMLEEADYEINTVFDRCVIVSCKLPNGFVITESTTFMPESFNEEIGVDICMDKIEEKLWELESYRLQNEIYEAEVLDECLNCECFDDGCDDCPFDIVYSRKNFGLDEE